jgi:hypothetical protein
MYIKFVKLNHKGNDIWLYAFVLCMLKMGKLWPKHVEVLNPNKSGGGSEVCIKLVVIATSL